MNNNVNGYYKQDYAINNLLQGRRKKLEAFAVLCDMYRWMKINL